jgi:glycosyltransferase involved in cell wall biosynthesis
MGSEHPASQPIELTILMPCLNEAETLGVCIAKAADFLARSGIAGEVLIADNGSTDGSQSIARAHGARVVPVVSRGYGAALIGGIEAARGRFVIMGDADDSYDFSRLDAFVGALRAGADLVMGNRFKGGIATGAMPPLHRYLGNPVLSFLGRLFFSIDAGDFHCGLRGFRRDAIAGLHLQTLGMEFASEMVVRAALAGLKIAEVPTTLRKDGRSRPPHLRTWTDGWRHLRFLLLYSPRWLFMYPGLALIGLGVLGAALLLPGPLKLADGLTIDVHTFYVACMGILVGTQSLTFGLLARRYGAAQGFLPASPRLESALSRLTLERLLLVALVLLAAGLAGAVSAMVEWGGLDFGPVHYSSLLRRLILSLTALAAGTQLGLAGFLGSVMEIKHRQPEG